MKFLAAFTLASMALAATAAPADRPSAYPLARIPKGAAEVIPNKYIVTLKPETKAAEFVASTKRVIEKENSREGVSIMSEINHEYNVADQYKGFAAQLSKSMVEKLKKSDKVAVVEPDYKVYALGTQRNPPSWGLSRISYRKGTGNYVFPDNAGQGVDVFVIDTGIDTAHRDFGGRAKMVFKSDSSFSNTDDNGHGTHCAGTVGATTYGVAKKANLYGVKVLGADGSGSMSGIIAGINYVAKYARDSRKTVIASMSLGGPYHQGTNNAVAAAYRAGVAAVIAAGNESQDACNVSPASSGAGLTVGATRSGDRFDTSYSNYGECVHILAPGTDITSTWPGGRANTISGTSMATPHVAGAAALWLGVNPKQTPDEVLGGLLNWSTEGAMSSVPRGTPNKFLYVGQE